MLCVDHPHFPECAHYNPAYLRPVVDSRADPVFSQPIQDETDPIVQPHQEVEAPALQQEGIVNQINNVANVPQYTNGEQSEVFAPVV